MNNNDNKILDELRRHGKIFEDPWDHWKKCVDIVVQ